MTSADTWTLVRKGLCTSIYGCPFAAAPVKSQVAEVQKMAFEFAQSSSFENLLHLCEQTRNGWDALHDAWLYNVGDDRESVFQSVSDFIAAVDQIGSHFDVLSEFAPEHRKCALHYKDSILLRKEFAETLLVDDIEGVYSRLFEVADPERISSKIPHPIDFVGDDQTLRIGRQFLLVAQSWLCHKLSLLAAELTLESGPFVPSTADHSPIAHKMLHSIMAIAKISMKRFGGDADQLPGSLNRLLDLCTRLDREIVGPIFDVVTTAPGRYTEGEAEQVIRRSRDIALVLLTEAAEHLCEIEDGVATSGLEMAAPDFNDSVEELGVADRPDARENDFDERAVQPLSNELFVLIYREGDRYFAHCLQVDIVGHGETIDEALRIMTELIDVHRTYAEHNELTMPDPAPEEYFERYDEASDFRGRIPSTEHSFQVRQMTE